MKALCAEMVAAVWFSLRMPGGIFTDKTTFIAVDGPHDAYVQNGLVYLKMADVRSVQRESDFDFLNTGSPHYVAFVGRRKGYQYRQ